MSQQNTLARQRPKIFTGAIVGGLLMAPLMALLYLGDRFAGLPFLPFDLFDWVARILPGPLVTFGIDVMVEALRALNIGALDEAAKLSEQLMGLGLFWLLGVIAGAIFFFVLNRLKGVNPITGVICGALLSLPLLLISTQVNTTATADPLLRAGWIVLVMVGFGVLLYWAYASLIARPRDAAKAKPTPANDLDRRQFLVRVGGASAVLTVVGAGLGALLNTRAEDIGSSQVQSAPTADAGERVDGSGNPLPNADDSLVAAPGTRPEYTPVADHYRIDIASRPPVIDGETYTLPITGLVANPVEWTLEDIRAMPSESAFITMACISNRIAGPLISTTKWTGVPMQEILERIEPLPEAGALRITGADGFDEYVSLDLIREDPRLMLAYAWDDQPLPQQNGFPLRIHIPDLYGMKQPKWITGIEVVEEYGEGYWVRRGWSAVARVNSTSVIDTVAQDSIYQDGEQFLVPIGGIAWAGARGISRVEVRVNEGEWVEADLREPLSERTWVIWRYDWPFEAGEHTFTVRCYEGDGTQQIEREQGVRPDGATGLHSDRELLREPEPATDETTS